MEEIRPTYYINATSWVDCRLCCPVRKHGAKVCSIFLILQP